MILIGLDCFVYYMYHRYERLIKRRIKELEEKRSEIAPAAEKETIKHFSILNNVSIIDSDIEILTNKLGNFPEFARFVVLID